MDISYIHLAIPVFFALIGVEVLAARLLERDAYRFGDSIADLSCGIIQQVLGVFLKTALFAGYLWAFTYHRVLDIPAASAWAWAACFLGVDFLYYWFHRFSHEVNGAWAAHVVHHQSEEYNLTVALRQGALQPAISSVFYFPLAVLGFPPGMFLAASSFNTLYQFWIHTRLIGRLGPLEWVFNTPSHHRVHHGRNPGYIDRNHGGTLIIWDRLFGTFVAEEEEPVYGITRPVRSFNPLWANVQVWVEMAEMARRTRRLRDRLRLLWKRPGWRPPELGGYVPPRAVDPERDRKYEVPASRGLKAYVLAQFVVLTLGTTVYLFRAGDIPVGPRVAVAVGVVLSLAVLGGLLDRRAWAWPAEIVRVALVVVLGVGVGLLGKEAVASEGPSLRVGWGPRTEIMEGIDVLTLRAPRRDGSQAAGYVAVPSGGGPRPGPVFVLLAGSGCASPFSRKGDVFYKPFLFKDLVPHLGDWLLVVVEKRGVDFGFDPAQATDQSCSVEYEAHASLGSRIDDAVLVIERVVQEGLHDGGPLVVIGHSEGSDVAPGVAVASPYVSHLALFGFSATHGLVDVLDELRRELDAGRVTAEEFERAYLRLVERFEEIRARPSSAERYYGHSFERWASFGVGRPLGDLLEVQVPVFLGIASEDRPSPPFGADLAVAAFVKRGKDNLTVRNYVGCDHGYFEDGPSGPVSRQGEVVRDLLVWVNAHPSSRE